jgi:nucleoside-diphosphate-sugar epimerase
MACPRIVVAGSAEEPVGNEVPASPYAAAKASATLYFRMFHRVYQLPVVIVRPFVAYGPRQAVTKLIPHAITALLQGKSPELASGRRICDFVFVTDVVRGLCQAGLTDAAVGRTLDLGNGVATTIREAIELVAEMTGTGAKPVFGALPDRVADDLRIADLASTRSVLGWEPKWPLRAGFEATIDWYRQELKIPA